MGPKFFWILLYTNCRLIHYKKKNLQKQSCVMLLSMVCDIIICSCVHLSMSLWVYIMSLHFGIIHIMLVFCTFSLFLHLILLWWEISNITWLHVLHMCLTCCMLRWFSLIRMFCSLASLYAFARREWFRFTSAVKFSVKSHQNRLSVS